MENAKKDIPNLSNLTEFGHECLEGFAKYIGVDYDTLIEINQKNAKIINDHKIIDKLFKD